MKEKFVNDNRFEILGASSLISKYKKADDAGYKKVHEYSGLGVHAVRWLGNRLAII